jgi:hypothetical protein
MYGSPVAKIQLQMSLCSTQAFIGTGFNVLMSFDPCSSNFNPAHRQCDFDREHGKVSSAIHSSNPFKCLVCIYTLELLVNLNMLLVAIP